MLTTLATLAGLALAQQTDTTVPVRAGARLEVNNFGGEIAVKVWSKSAVRITASHSSRDRIIVDASEQVVRVKSEGRRGPSQVVDYDITVPAAMALALSGVYTDLRETLPLPPDTFTAPWTVSAVISPSLPSTEMSV